MSNFSKIGGEIMSAKDYLQFVTEQVVTYLDMPKEKRRQRKETKKRQERLMTNKWFGVIPLALKMLRDTSNKQAK